MFFPLNENFENSRLRRKKEKFCHSHGDWNFSSTTVLWNLLYNFFPLSLLNFERQKFKCQGVIVKRKFQFSGPDVSGDGKNFLTFPETFEFDKFRKQIIIFHSLRNVKIFQIKINDTSWKQRLWNKLKSITIFLLREYNFLRLEISWYKTVQFCFYKNIIFYV